ncbi:MAG: succinylglutamate desuccinylase/aspartoacylase family protein [Polaromonas sp.]|nr:succinylglutamate desuccinylase/aspartoacylase family protein [Polaromonas sp.]
MSAASLTPHVPAPHAVELQAPDISPWADSPLGTPYVHERSSGVAGPEVLVTALMHGNEFSGAWALDAFLRSGLQLRRGRVTAAFCNVAAFHQFDTARPDASRFADEDMNRVWSAARLDGDAHSTELARARALRPFADRATHLLDLHSMHEPCEPLLVAGTLARNTAFGRSLGLGAQVIVDEGHADGVRLRDYGPFGDPQGQAIALLLEAGQHWDIASLHTARNALMRFLLAAAVVERADIPAGWLLPDAPSPAAIDVTHRVVAQSPDFAFAQDFQGGELIAQQGTVIAIDAGQPVTTPYDDCVLVMPSIRQLRPGVTTVRLGRRRSVSLA